MQIHDISNYAMVNSMRTGNIVFDMIVAMLITMLMTFLMNYSTRIDICIQDKWNQRGEEYYYRDVSFDKHFNKYGDSYWDNDDNTVELLKALNLYITEKFKCDHRDGDVKFIDMDERSDDSEDEMYEYDSRLRRIRDSYLLHRPNKNIWVHLTPNLEYTRGFEEIKDENNNEGKE